MLEDEPWGAVPGFSSLCVQPSRCRRGTMDRSRLAYFLTSLKNVNFSGRQGGPGASRCSSTAFGGAELRKGALIKTRPSLCEWITNNLIFDIHLYYLVICMCGESFCRRRCWRSCWRVQTKTAQVCRPRPLRTCWALVWGRKQRRSAALCRWRAKFSHSDCIICWPSCFWSRKIYGRALHSRSWAWRPMAWPCSARPAVTTQISSLPYLYVKYDNETILSKCLNVFPFRNVNKRAQSARLPLLEWCLQLNFSRFARQMGQRPLSERLQTGFVFCLGLETLALLSSWSNEREMKEKQRQRKGNRVVQCFSLLFLAVLLQFKGFDAMPPPWRAAPGTTPCSCCGLRCSRTWSHTTLWPAPSQEFRRVEESFSHMKFDWKLDEVSRDW